MFFSALLFSMMSFAGVVTFDADVDQGNAGTDSNNAAAYTITKDGVTVEVSSGILGTYNNEMHYRIYKNQTLKITSTAGNITSVQFTCTGNGSEKYGPGCFTVDSGDYTNDGAAVGTWTGSATEITFTASANQVRATQIVVATDGAEIPDQPEEPETPETPDVPAPEGVITCAEALAICEATGETSTTESYTIRGYVTEIKTVYSEQYGNISFWMADTPDGGKVLQAYRVKPVNAADINVAVGDFVEVVGTLVNYMGNTPEVNQGGTYTIVTPGSGETPENPETPETPETPEGGIVFDADVDMGNASTDFNTAGAYEVTKSGVTLNVSSGIIGTYNNENHYRIYKSQTITLTSTVGNITSVSFTCTANDAEKYGPGCLTVDGGEYTYSGAVGTWTGSASEITFTASTNQVRATQIVVVVEGGETPDTDVVNVKDLSYADAYYYEEEGTALWEIQLYNIDEAAEAYMMPIVFVGIEAKSKTSLNGTYDMLLALYGTTLDEETYEVDGVWNDETIAATLTIKNVDNDNNYSFVGTFVGEDGKTYKINTVANVYAEDDTTGEVIELKEDGNNDPVTPPTPPTPDGAVTFDADVDQGNAGTDSNNAAAYQITKSGVTMEVSSGILGTYNNEMHYRIYKNQTLTLTSTVGKIVKVEFTCTANDAEKYGPGCFTVDGGDYTYAGPVGTWTGSADAIVFTASSNQVRATQVVVTLESTGTGVEDVVTVEVPVKVIENGQLMIIRGENVYNVLGAQVK